MRLDVSHQFLPRQNSVRASLVMDHFGIDFEQGAHVIARDFEIPIQPGQVVLFNGESGSGKSSLMRAAAQNLVASGERVIHLDQLVWGEQILVDLLALPLDSALPLLAACGLGEAHLMLRTPGELSDGQRYRFQLALALSRQPNWIVADEFTATLDRKLAGMIAFNLRKLAARTGVGFLLATTHEDVVSDLSPDLQIRCRLDGEIDVFKADDPTSPIKKKCPSWQQASGSRQRPSATGRISLGGITAAMISG